MAPERGVVEGLPNLEALDEILLIGRNGFVDVGRHGLSKRCSSYLGRGSPDRKSLGTIPQR